MKEFIEDNFNIIMLFGTVIFILAFVAGILIHAYQSDIRCTNKGGVVLRGTCYEASSLRVIPNF